VPPVAEILRDGFEQRYPERALSRFSTPSHPARPVVEKAAGRARFIYSDWGTRLLVWADDSALLETVTATVPLTTAPKASGGKERVWVAPGAIVKRERATNGFVATTVEDRTLEVKGYLPESALGRVFVPAALPAGTGTEGRLLERRSPPLGRAGGRPLARFLDPDGHPVLVDVVAQGASWFVEIEYRSTTLSVRGFVPKSALSDPNRYGVAGGVGYGRAARRNPPEERLTFAAGACLYAEPWGEIVGVLVRRRTESVHVETGERAAWRELDMGWAGARVWVARAEGSATEPETKDDPVNLAQGFDCPAPPPR
jgi:hypothetical protein